MNHELLRDCLSIDRPTQKLPTGKWRYLMQTQLNEEAYGQRWQVETVMFMLKRNQGPSLAACQRWTRHREMALIALTHNIMIVWT